MNKLKGYTPPKRYNFLHVYPTRAGYNHFVLLSRSYKIALFKVPIGSTSTYKRIFILHTGGVYDSVLITWIPANGIISHYVLSLQES